MRYTRLFPLYDEIRKMKIGRGLQILRPRPCACVYEQPAPCVTGQITDSNAARAYVMMTRLFDCTEIIGSCWNVTVCKEAVSDGRTMDTPRRIKISITSGVEINHFGSRKKALLPHTSSPTQEKMDCGRTTLGRTEFCNEAPIIIFILR